MDIESLQAICKSLPGVTEDIKWEHDLCFCVGSKMFCVTGLHDRSSVTFKVRDEEFDELCERPGISPAPYLARAKWVAVEPDSSLSMAEWQHYIRQSYELVLAKLPKKLRNELSGGEGTGKV